MDKKQQSQVEGSNSSPLCQEKRVVQGTFTKPKVVDLKADEGILLMAEKALLSFGWELDHSGLHVIARLRLGDREFQVRTLGERGFEDSTFDQFQEAFNGNLKEVIAHQWSIGTISPEVRQELDACVGWIARDIQPLNLCLNVHAVEPDTRKREDFWWVGFHVDDPEDDNWSVWIDEELVKREGESFWTSLSSKPYEFLVAGYTDAMRAEMASRLPDRRRFG